MHAMHKLSGLRERAQKEPGLLKRSAQIVTAESKVRSKLFRSWPDFLQNTLSHPLASDFEAAWRHLPVEERLSVATRLKDEGNGLFRAGKCKEAILKYEKAAGVSRYVQETGSTPDGALDDLHLRLVASEDQDEAALRAICYSNIAQCILQGDEPDHAAAVRACSEALMLQPENSKALYRRALAHEGLGDLEAAMTDLNQATAATPGNAAVEAAKRRVAAELRARSGARKELFQGFLSRSQLGGASERATAAAAASAASAADLQAGADLEEKLARALRLREACLAENRLEEAEEAEGTVKLLQERLEERRSRATDIFCPSEDLRREARKFGIDLDKAEDRRRLDEAMWKAHRAEQLPDGDGPASSEEEGRKRKELLGRLRDAAFSALVLLGVLFLFLRLRGYL